MGATVGKGGGNFLDALPSQTTLHVVMLGLDSAGKTTALYRLKFDQYLNTVPTIGFNCEKVQGTIGKAKGVQFLVWDVGGQEKLRPLWRSYTRCTDGILFVVDSVDVERMEEAKIELMRTAKCPDNQGVPVLILANKQDLPGARDPKDLEKLLGLHELMYQMPLMSTSSSSTGNIIGCSSNANACSNSLSYSSSLTPISQHSKTFVYGSVNSKNNSREINTQLPTAMLSSVNSLSSTGTTVLEQCYDDLAAETSTTSSSSSQKTETLGQEHSVVSDSKSLASVTTPTVVTNNLLLTKKMSSTSGMSQYKGWYIQPACAITGEGLQEGLEALYEMILKRRKLNKAHKKRR